MILRRLLPLLCATVVAVSLDIAETSGEGPSQERPLNESLGLSLVPWPQSIQRAGGLFALPEDARIVAETPSLLRLANVLAEEIRATCSVELKVAADAARPGDIVLRLSDNLKGEAYTVRIVDTASVEGGNYDAVALGTVSLLQLLGRDGSAVVLPRLTLKDRPHSDYRGLLIDVARKHHSIDTLRQCAELCRMYKIKYLQLHLTDDPAFTFPSTAYPQLTSKNYHGGPAYTLDELKGLEAYASARGVAIVPEFEVPGHAGTMNRTMPDLFKIKGTKPYEHHATINFADPKVLKAVETIVGEMCDVFKSSPYFHIGGDEADFAFAHQHPDFQAAFKRFDLGDKGQWQLYRRFLLQMNEIVKRRGKRMIVWEGFHRDPESQFQIPKDVTVMEYECPFYPPRQLIEDGYTMINAAWTPLYVVNRKRWTPEQIYAWNLHLLGQHSTNYATTTWHQLEPTPQIIGAQMCSWEQPQTVEISSLRTRLPAMSERIWNPDAGRSYDDYARRAAATDRLLSRLIPTVRIKANGLAEPDHNMNDVPVFHTKLTVSLESERPAAEIRYTLDGQMPVSSVAAAEPSEPGSPIARRVSSSLTYTGPLELETTTTVTAAAFDAEGHPVGHAVAEVFYNQK